MKILVHGPSAEGDHPRLRAAAWALAERAHAVTWMGGTAPAATGAEAPATRRRGFSLDPPGADVVVGGSGRPLGLAALAWAARASCVVAGLRAVEVRRWSAVGRWAWHSVSHLGLVDEAEADAFRPGSSPLDPERLGLWSPGPAAEAPDAAHPDTEILERACERGLVRARRRSRGRAVFLDRDGTLVREVGYLARPEQVELLPGAAEALRQLEAAGFARVVFSNQSGIARGMFTERDVLRANARLRRLLAERGASLDAIYYCPHLPEEGCPCRKPRPGLLDRAEEDLLLDLTRSVVVGDKRIDLAAGRARRAAGVLVRTGCGCQEEKAVLEEGGAARPDFVATDLLEAASWILRRADD